MSVGLFVIHALMFVLIIFSQDNRVHIGPKMEMRVVTLGLDDSGKTSILFQLKQNEFTHTIPTIGELSRMSLLTPYPPSVSKAG